MATSCARVETPIEAKDYRAGDRVDFLWVFAANCNWEPSDYKLRISSTEDCLVWREMRIKNRTDLHTPSR